MLVSTDSRALKLQDFFEKTYIINLPERTDRRREVAAELNMIGMPLRQGKVEIFSAIRPNDSLAFPSTGVLGCFLSHLAILKQASKERLSSVLIIEDDITFSKGFKSLESCLVDLLMQQDWSIVFLGFNPYQGYSYSDYCSKDVECLGDQSVTLKRCTLPPAGSHFYGVKGSSLAPLIDYLDSFLEKRQREEFTTTEGGLVLDGAYYDTVLHLFKQQIPGVTSLIACPSLGAQRSSRSDITPSKLDQLPIPTPLVKALRVVKRQFSRM
ncbi:MAG: glycosyltransferase family 25 protein [Nostoc sp. C3-bin3]|nr:glycosyltransferase family 25 protein [Cyanobacteria bacterium Co-bin13]MBD0388384.1 glycosyltransferase family 25 protein [Nostoc sp. C3-bin3]